MAPVLVLLLEESSLLSGAPVAVGLAADVELMSLLVAGMLDDSMEDSELVGELESDRVRVPDEETPTELVVGASEDVDDGIASDVVVGDGVSVVGLGVSYKT